MYPSATASVLIPCVSRWVVFSSLWSHGLPHAVHACDGGMSSTISWSLLKLMSIDQCYYLTISSSAVPFSSCPQPFLASGSLSVSQLFASGGQSIGASASASVLPMNIQGWFPFGFTGLISLQSEKIIGLLLASNIRLLQKPVLEKPSTTLGELEKSGLLHQRAQRS